MWTKAELPTLLKSLADGRDESGRPFSPRRLEYVDIHFGRGPDYYKSRLEILGVGSGDRLLDIGTGPGQWAFAAAELGATTLGVDSCEEYISIANRLQKEIGAKNLEFRTTSGEQLEFPRGSFDVVLIICALMYMDHPLMFESANSWLANGGLLYIGNYHWEGMRYNQILRGNSRENLVNSCRIQLRRFLSDLGAPGAPFQASYSLSEKGLEALALGSGFAIEQIPNITNLPKPSFGRVGMRDIALRRTCDVEVGRLRLMKRLAWELSNGRCMPTLKGRIFPHIFSHVEQYEEAGFEPNAAGCLVRIARLFGFGCDGFPLSGATADEDTHWLNALEAFVTDDPALFEQSVRALAKHPDYADVLLLRGLKLLLAERWDAARADLNDLADRRPGSPESWVGLVLTAALAGDEAELDRAKAGLRRALQIEALQSYD